MSNAVKTVLTELLTGATRSLAGIIIVLVVVHSGFVLLFSTMSKDIARDALVGASIGAVGSLALVVGVNLLFIPVSWVGMCFTRKGERGERKNVGLLIPLSDCAKFVVAATVFGAVSLPVCVGAGRATYDLFTRDIDPEGL